MVCIHCGFETRVMNSRHQKRRNQVWRRRSCPACGLIFTTEESIKYDALWVVQSKDKQLAPFSRDKLLLSIYKSCAHRPTAVSDAAGLTTTIIGRLEQTVENSTVTATAITAAIQIALTRFDQAAAAHYTVYHQR